MERRDTEIVSQISEQQLLEHSHLTPGLFEVFTRKDALGLPQLPGSESIYHLHKGTFDK